jgi:hypothetical protein
MSKPVPAIIAIVTCLIIAAASLLLVKQWTERIDVRVQLLSQKLDAMAAQRQALQPQVAQPPPPSPEAIVALGKGRQLLNEAHSRGKWLDADRDTLLQLLGAMDDPGRTEMFRELTKLINSGQLRLETKGPPL